ncbi:MAG TPA: hypothetical protein PLZ15_08655 [Melioribacteraceae bacterium]|nr:hypothetical protein [Melioribacteraceae bacterium]
MNRPVKNRQIILPAIAGLIIIILFAVGFIWLYTSYKGEEFLSLAPYWIYSYLGVTCLYSGFFTARFAKAKGRKILLWGSLGFLLTLIFTITIPGLLSPLIPYEGPEIFAGPAILAFLAPVLSVIITLLLISIRKKEN